MRACQRLISSDEIFRDLLVAHEPQREAKHPYMVPSVEHLHGKPVARGNPSDQDLVRSRLGRTQRPTRKVGRVDLGVGSNVTGKIFAK